jgi:hypothetical protein
VSAIESGEVEPVMTPRAGYGSTERLRTIGFVALGDVLGDVQYRYWPAATWTRFGALTE